MSRSQWTSPAGAKDTTARHLCSTIADFIQDRLLDRDRRLHHKEQCAERLAAGGAGDVRYSDQAVLANLDWGIDALEEAIATSNPEAKLARLDHAERMLQVAAMLDPAASTAGVPNSYLSAWAHLNLAFLSALRGGGRSTGAAALHHALEMFDVDPFFARIDFAPELWEALFLPHMASVVGWYSEARHRVVMEVIPDASDLSLTVDQLFNDSVIMSVRPDQADKLRGLEKTYADSLDRNTQMYARYYKDLLSHDPAAESPYGGGKKGLLALPPIADPPMTPLHEVSRSIPNFVKFGPILPKSAGFSPLLRDMDSIDTDAAAANAVPSPGSNHRSSVSSNSRHEPGKSSKQRSKENLLEENEDEIDSDGSDFIDSEVVTPKIEELNCMRPNIERERVTKIPSSRKKQSTSPDAYSPTDSTKEKGNVRKSPLSRKKTHSASLDDYSPVDSPKTPSPNVHSPKQFPSSKKEHEQLFRLLSSRPVTLSPKTFSNADSPKSTYHQVLSPPQKESEPFVRIRSNYSTPALLSPRLSEDLNASPIESDDEMELGKSCKRNLSIIRSQPHASMNNHVSTCSFQEENEEATQNNPSLPSSGKLTPRSKPPKDFVCAITGQLFNDPVTLETGQTYERRAIQEWLKRGNTTCPITRQLLSATVLPKTNYVLKRLITSWMEQNPDLAQEFSYSETPSASVSPVSSRQSILESTTSENFNISPPQTGNNSTRSERRSKRFTRDVVSKSPTSVISQAASETVINGLKPYTSCLCTSEDLKECEAAVMKIARIWKDSKADPGVHAFLSEPKIVNGFVEILSASVDREALKTSIYVLSELIYADENVANTLMSVDTDFDCLAALLINGLAEASVLIYQLRPTFSQLSSHDLILSLVQVITSKGEQMDDLYLVIEPKDAAVAILDQILAGGDEDSRSINALSVITANGLPALIKCLNRVEGRASVVSILLSCMRADKNCRNVIANRAELAPVLELFHAGNDTTRGICIDFLSDLVCLNRRTFCNQILQIIKDEGTFSTMHTFLVYLQMAPMEQQPAVASLLLQLDLLAEPRKMSIYREEAIDAIIEALRRKDFPVCQTIALDTLTSLSGRLSASGKPLTEAWLLKIAGIDQPYQTLVKEDRTRLVDDVSGEEEVEAIGAWEKRVAFVLCNHDNGVIFKALEECLKSNSFEMAKSCLVIAAWLSHMLSSLPETGMKTIASQCLLDQFINVLQLSKNIEDKVLVSLALKSFITDPDSLKRIGTSAKRICKSLRKLKRCSTIVADTLKAIMNMPSVDITELWSFSELFEIDSSSNGVVMSMVHSKGRLFSSHSDGTIKVWDAGRRCLKLIQEVHEHTKAVTSLHIPSSDNKLYSGSHDKTIRVWTIGAEEIHCVQVHDMKETVNCLAINTNLVCFSSQGTGAKVHKWSGSSKHINFNRTVKSLAMTEQNAYCGCTGYSIQEIDLSNCTSNTLYSGTRKLLGKQSIHSLCIQDGVLFAGGSSVDGIAGKAFSLSTKTAVGSFCTELDIHRIFVSNDFVFTGTKFGIIEVWLRERFTKVGSIKVGSGASTKVTSLASDSEGEMLFAGSYDGKIQVWTLE